MELRGSGKPGAVSGLATFVQSLANDGQARVSSHAPDGQDADALPLLEQLDCAAREELALPLPAFSAPAALWGARLFHQLSRFVVCRDIGEAQITAACTVPCSDSRKPETIWSVDLTLHHLPRLFQLASHLSNADPLIGHMIQIAEAWPLSSVGIRGLKNFDLAPITADPSLLRLYADRIVAVDDTSRLGDPKIDDLLRADLGIHHELAPAFAAKLFMQHDTH